MPEPSDLTLTATPASEAAPIAARPSRILGFAALVIALVPIVAQLMIWFYPLVLPEPLLGAAPVLLVWTPIGGLGAVILGIVAVRRNRGRVGGMLAIILGSLVLFFGLVTIVAIAMTTSVYAGTY